MYLSENNESLGSRNLIVKNHSSVFLLKPCCPCCVITQHTWCMYDLIGVFIKRFNLGGSGSDAFYITANPYCNFFSFPNLCNYWFFLLQICCLSRLNIIHLKIFSFLQVLLLAFFEKIFVLVAEDKSDQYNYCWLSKSLQASVEDESVYKTPYFVSNNQTSFEATVTSTVHHFLIWD